MDTYREIIRLAAEGLPCALGLIVYTQGSTPQKAGAKGLLFGSGPLYGTLGGGMVEAKGLALMRAALSGAPPEMMEMRLDDEYSRQAGPICGGLMQILIFKPCEDSVDAYRRALEADRVGQRGALLTTLSRESNPPGRAFWVPEADASVASPIPDSDLQDCIRRETPQRVTTGAGEEIFVEPVVKPPRLLIVGGGHVGQDIARRTVTLGFSVTVTDDRAEFTRRELFPEDVAVIRGDVGEVIGEFPKGRDAYIVIVSRGHGVDALALDACIHSDVGYLGMIGSQRKVQLLRMSFLDGKLATLEEWDRMFAPIGIDAGAVTVPEIGVSVAAQLVAVRRKGAAALLEGLRINPRSERPSALRA